MRHLLQKIQSVAFIKPFSNKLFGLMLLFVLSQTAGVVHAVAHPFHAGEHGQGHGHNHEHEHEHGHEAHYEHESFHGVSCDVFDNLAQPVDKASTFLFSFVKPAPQIPFAFELRSVFDSIYQSHFFGRAPPIQA